MPSKAPEFLNHEPVAVRYARENANLKQRDAAGMLGISPQLLADIEAGRRSAQHAVLDKMVKVYSCPREVLVRKDNLGDVLDLLDGVAQLLRRRWAA